MGAKLSGQILIKFFGPNYSMHRTAWYLLWPMGAVKTIKMLRVPGMENVGEALHSGGDD